VLVFLFHNSLNAFAFSVGAFVNYDNQINAKNMLLKKLAKVTKKHGIIRKEIGKVTFH
jgi:hypothetical protein